MLTVIVLEIQEKLLRNHNARIHRSSTEFTTLNFGFGCAEQRAINQACGLTYVSHIRFHVVTSSTRSVAENFTISRLQIQHIEIELASSVDMCESCENKLAVKEFECISNDYHI